VLTFKASPDHARRLLIAATVGGFLVRLALVAVSLGSNDIFTWELFGRWIARRGLLDLYAQNPTFNHPPLPGYYSAAAIGLADGLHVPFAIVFKLPIVCCDAFAAYLLFKLWSRRRDELIGWKGAAMYAWGLTPILVSSYHGNTDSVAAAAWLLSVYLATERRADFAAGLALAAAINVKLIPILGIPAAFAHYRSSKRATRFLDGLALGLLPFVPVVISVGPAFYRNAIAYNSSLDLWGLPGIGLLLSKSPGLLGQLGRALATLCLSLGKPFIVFAVLASAAWSRWKSSIDPYALAALAPALFLALTPGFGIQYTQYLCPLLYAASLGDGVLWATSSGLFIGLVYLEFWTGTFPWRSVHATSFPMPSPIVGLVAWVVLVGIIPRLWLGRTAKVNVEGCGKPDQSDPEKPR
jgi:Glycosyltransferase family 87